MADRPGKTKISELRIELYVDDDVRSVLQDILDGKKESFELSNVYFRHLFVDDLKHEGLKVGHFKIPVGRITKFKLKVVSP